MEAVPEVAPPVEKPPAAVQDVAPVDDQVKVEDWPLLIVEGFALSVAVGGNRVQESGLDAPLLHTSEPSGSLEVPPGPVHPPLLHAVHAPPAYPSPFGHWVHVGGLFVPLLQPQLVPFQTLPEAHTPVTVTEFNTDVELRALKIVPV